MDVITEDNVTITESVIKNGLKNKQSLLLNISPG